MRAHFGLPSVLAETLEGRPPIHVRFEIPYFTVSGIQVSASRRTCHTLCLRAQRHVFRPCSGQ